MMAIFLSLMQIRLVTQNPRLTALGCDCNTRNISKVLKTERFSKGLIQNDSSVPKDLNLLHPHPKDKLCQRG